MEMPTTKAELLDVLSTFRDTDMNGDGDATRDKNFNSMHNLGCTLLINGRWLDETDKLIKALVKSYQGYADLYEGLYLPSILPRQHRLDLRNRCRS